MADGEPVLRPRSRWLPAAFADLPGWQDDRPTEFWPALRNACSRPAPGWSELCARAVLETPADDASARAWLQRWLQPYRVESVDGVPEGLVTGYYEPLIEASRRPAPGYAVPLYRPPPDLAKRRPYWTRQELDSVPAAAAALRGLEIAWIRDPIDALMLQIQGSGRLQFSAAPGVTHTVRVAFAGHNDHPYRSLSHWLAEQGELAAPSVSWPAIKAWAHLNPERVPQLLAANPRVVFFREEHLADPSIGPRGALGVPLVPQRSIAVDPGSIPYGSAVWLDTSAPLSATPLRRLVMALDTGSAITGAVRADYFWGWGEVAEAQAARMKQPLRMWVLWPKR